MCGPRTSVSRIWIGAPQSGQMQVGATGWSGVGSEGSAVSVPAADPCSSSRAGQVFPASGIGEPTVVAGAVKARGQHMQQEAAYDPRGGEGHCLVSGPSLGAIVLPAEGD